MSNPGFQVYWKVMFHAFPWLFFYILLEDNLRDVALTTLGLDSCYKLVWFSLRYVELIFEGSLSLALMNDSGHENYSQGISQLPEDFYN